MSVLEDRLLPFIKDEAIKEFVRPFLLKPEVIETFKKTASSSGKYHPEKANGPWGLLWHTIKCLQAADRIIRLYEGMGKISKTKADICRAGLILHDAWKYETINGKISPATTKGHGYVGYLKIMQSPDFEHKVDIAEVVRFHMSNWNGSAEETKLAQNVKGIHLHIAMIADMIASDKKLLGE